MVYGTFQEQLAAALATHRHRVAIEWNGEQITYQALEAASGAIAHRLIHGQHVQKGDFVGILTGNRRDLIYAIIGIMRAGAVFVPLDTALPAGRLRAMNESVPLALLLTSGPVPAFPGPLPVPVLPLEEIAAAPAAEAPGAVAYAPEDPLYVYFTSGSTGTPKAIVGQNKSLAHFVNWEIETFDVRPGSRFSQFVTTGFDACLRDLFVPLFAGGTICIPDTPDTILNAHTLATWVDAMRINYIHCVPSLFRLLNGAFVHAGLFRELKCIFLSGEKIVPGELKNWYDAFGDRVQLVNFYGTTETTLIKTWYLIQPADAEADNIPVGKAMKGAQVLVLDPDLKVCEQLVPGEIYIITPYKTKGYYNDLELNARKFIANPHRDDPDYQLFRTGDKGRVLPGGNLELLGRIDRQIKLRGVRVEPDEIERVLVTHPSVVEAAVVESRAGGSQVLCACVVPAGGAEPRALIDQITAFLEPVLPQYMIPGKFIFLPALPRKANGKTDFAALREQANATGPAFVPPRTPREEQLFGVWAGILGNRDFGVQNTFFETGGNSFHLISLIAQIHRLLNVRLSIADIFKHTTVEKLAGLIECRDQEAYQRIPRADAREHYPLSPAQFRVFHHQLLHPESTAYNLPQFFVLKGPLDADRLGKTFQALLDRHESLRTYFKTADNEPVQCIRPHVPAPVWYHDLETEADESLVARYVRDFVRPFDLEAGPLVRMGLIRQGPEAHILLIDLHHIVADGVSQDLLKRDFMRLYAGEPVPEAELQYKDYAAWYAREKQRGAFEKQQAYWLARLAPPLPALALPAGYPGYDPNDQAGAVIHFELDAAPTRALRTLAREAGTTPYVLFLSLYYVLLAKLSGQEDIVVGTAVSGRRHKSLENTIGMFVNTLALRDHPRPDLPFDAFLAQVHAHVVAALDNQEYPLEDLIQQLKLPRTDGNASLFNVMFVFQPPESVQEAGTGFTVHPYGEAGQQTSKFDLTFFGRETGETLSCRMEYSTQRFSAAQIERMVGYYRDIVTQVLEDPRAPLRDISLQHDLQTAVARPGKIEFKF